MVDGLLVAVHVPAGLVAVASGAGAMLARKGSRAHRLRGLVYAGALGVVCATGIGLGITRWPRFPHLIALSCLSATLLGVGYGARRRPSPALHFSAMGASYVVMLTAFYVDNGPKLPLWRLLPPVAFWVLPTLVALPFFALAFRRHVGALRRLPEEARRAEGR